MFKFLSSTESLKEFSSAGNVFGLTSATGTTGSPAQFDKTVAAMKVLAKIKVSGEPPETLSKFLAETDHKDKISAKILAQAWTKTKFEPTSGDSDLQNLVFDLLVTFLAHLCPFV